MTGAMWTLSKLCPNWMVVLQPLHMIQFSFSKWLITMLNTPPSSYKWLGKKLYNKSPPENDGTGISDPFLLGFSPFSGANCSTSGVFPTWEAPFQLPLVPNIRRPSPLSKLTCEFFRPCVTMEVFLIFVSPTFLTFPKVKRTCRKVFFRMPRSMKHILFGGEMKSNTSFRLSKYHLIASILSIVVKLHLFTNLNFNERREHHSF